MAGSGWGVEKPDFRAGEPAKGARDGVFGLFLMKTGVSGRFFGAVE
jgi:hypothetical protein